MQEHQEQRISWRWRDVTIDLGLGIRGEGPTLLMLPALSSISTRREMAPLQERLASRFRTVAIDWPGFGDLPRPVYGEQTPRRSRAEIEALAAIPGMSSVMLPLGKLSFYEEFPDATAAAISPFLAEGA